MENCAKERRALSSMHIAFLCVVECTLRYAMYRYLGIVRGFVPSHSEVHVLPGVGWMVGASRPTVEVSGVHFDHTSLRPPNIFSNVLATRAFWLLRCSVWGCLQSGSR